MLILEFILGLLIGTFTATLFLFIEEYTINKNHNKYYILFYAIPNAISLATIVHLVIRITVFKLTNN